MNIVDFYRNLGVKNEKTAQFLAENTRTAKRRKGYMLRSAGDDLNTILFYLNGVARYSFIDDEGRESVMGFRAGPGPCVGTLDIEGPIHMNVEAVTDMTILELPKTVMMQAFGMDSTLYPVAFHQMAELQMQNYRWQIAMKTKDSKEKYQWFLEQYGDLADAVTQKDIANFLNITPQTLCRVKRDAGPARED